MMRGDMTKLPKWAQQKILHLEQVLDSNKKYYTDKADALSCKKETRVGVHHRYDAPPDFYIEEGERIAFLFGEETITVRLDTKRNCVVLDGYSRLVITPEVCNSIAISLQGKDKF